MRSIEVCFSDDAIRRGQVDERYASMLELNALVRKLFGLGRIPLTLSCTIEGVAFVFIHIKPFSMLSVFIFVSLICV